MQAVAGLFLTLLPAALIGMASAADPADAELPKNIRVAIQYVEVPHPLFTELMPAPPTRRRILHEQVMARVAKGEAKIIESCIGVAPHAGKGKAEAIREVIYPTEYDPPSLPCSPSPSDPLPWRSPPSAWDTRNTGVTFEVEPNISENGTVVNLRILPEIVMPVRMETWKEYRDHWGDASFRTPVFRTLRLNNSLTLVAGRFDLAGVLTPKPVEPAPAVRQKVLIFVRADVITLHPNP